jgi:hypothetical protein
VRTRIEGVGCRPRPVLGWAKTDPKAREISDTRTLGAGAGLSDRMAVFLDLLR